MITVKASELKSFDQKSKGLIGAEKARAVFFKTHFGIHTFGVKFPIDIVILDKGNRVVQIKKGLKPNRIFFWNPKFEKVLELPVGEIEKKGIKKGEIINLELIQ